MRGARFTPPAPGEHVCPLEPMLRCPLLGVACGVTVVPHQMQSQDARAARLPGGPLGRWAQMSSGSLTRWLWPWPLGAQQCPLLQT